MKKAIMILIIAVLAIIVVTAGIFLFPYSPNNPPKADDSNSTQQGIQEVVNANNHFAVDLYNQYNTKKENVFFSPYSISTALAMTYEGAKGQTADEMQKVFYFPEKNILESNSAAIYNDINKKNKEYQLSTGNALWAQQDYVFLKDYLKNVEKYYGGKAANLDFKTKTEEARQTINSFIEKQTNDKIKDLIPQGILNPSTRLVLTNAVYFKGQWMYAFNKKDTTKQDFDTGNKYTGIVQADMMHLNDEEDYFNYSEDNESQILELNYKGNDLSMLVILPKNNYDPLQIDLDKINQLKSSMREEKVDILLPKFTFETKYMMVDDLKQMGMPTAFIGGGADFSGMDGSKDLYIQNVIHQAYIAVDEEGTEAAAATAVVVGIMAVAPSEHIIFNANHPFIFIIQQKSTGNILFMGKVLDPTK